MCKLIGLTVFHVVTDCSRIKVDSYLCGFIGIPFDYEWQLSSHS
jgi:hypothetical protein